MTDIKQTWRLIIKKTGEPIIDSTSTLDEIKVKSLELIESGDDMKYQIMYFENDLIVETVDLTVYF